MLGNFSYENPTKIYFGKKSILHLPEELQKYGKKFCWFTEEEALKGSVFMIRFWI